MKDKALVPGAGSCAVAAIVAVSVGCAMDEGRGAAPLEPSERAALARAQLATSALANELMQHLMQEMAGGGPTEAVRVCSEVAQELATSHSGDGLSVRRVSLKARNPADAPDPYERDVLLEFQRLADRGRLPDDHVEIVQSDEGARLRYLRPITVMPTCLACHGPAETIDPAVAQALASHYPDDEALGYAAGDLRGAFSVIVGIE